MDTERCRPKLTVYDCAVFRVCVPRTVDGSWSDYSGMQSSSVDMDEDGAAVTTFTSELVDHTALALFTNCPNSLGPPLLSAEVLSEDSAKQADRGQTGGPQAIGSTGGL
jgi:hypothetical protein